MNEKKTVEVVKGNGNEARVTKRIHYYSNGKIKSEINISNGKANGKSITFHSNGAVASKGKFYSGNVVIVCCPVWSVSVPVFSSAALDCSFD